VHSQGLGGDRVRVYRADVAEVDSIVAAGEACIEVQGLPDVVLACAGISVGMDSAVRADLDVMREVFATNNIGLAATFQPFVQWHVPAGFGPSGGCGQRGGDTRGLPGHGAYCASKAGVVAYCESLRLELRGSGVHVVTLLPGYIATPLTARNPYSMPFLMPVQVFAERAFRAVSRGRSYCVIPWQMAVVAKLLRLLPNPLYDRLFAGRGRKARRG
jgi:NAD(P)-dependent dehydrogenase (short-subunit alcohol dehydrogenase family)